MSGKYRSLNDDAVTPVIGTVLILGIMLVVTGALLSWGIPNLQSNEAYANYMTCYNNLLNLQHDIEDVSTQGEGASRVSSVSLSAGDVTFKKDSETFSFVYTSVSSVVLDTEGLSNGSDFLRVYDLDGNLDLFNVTIFYPDGEEIQYNTSDNEISLSRNLISDTSGIISDVNGTELGGFILLGVDELFYNYQSVAGVYSMSLISGSTIAKEPSSQPYLVSTPLTLGSLESGTISFYSVDLNLDGSRYSAIGTGNYEVSLRNQGGSIESYTSIYHLRLHISGDFQTPLYYGYQSYFDFEKDPFGNEIYIDSDNPIDFRLLERDVDVSISLR